VSVTSQLPQEGVDGAVVRYRERLVPPWWAWLVVVFITGSLAIAYGYATTAVVGIVTFALTTAAVAWGLLATTVVIRVDDRVLRVGRARLPLEFVGPATALDPRATAALRGPDADARAHLCLRSWIGTAVRVQVADDRDPHPYWLVSTRNPAAVVAALHDGSAG
jgi:hypothetical protein